MRNRKNYISLIDILDKEIKAFKKISGDKCTIFKLNGENSIFDQELIWPIIHKFPQGGVTTDYIQYLLIIPNSPAAEPLWE